MVNYARIFNPNLANNFIFSDLWYSAIFQSTNINAANAAFPEILCSADTSMSCLGAAGGFFPFAFFFPQGRNVEQLQLVDDLSITSARSSQFLRHQLRYHLLFQYHFVHHTDKFQR